METSGRKLLASPAFGSPHGVKWNGGRGSNFKMPQAGQSYPRPSNPSAPRADPCHSPADACNMLAYVGVRTLRSGFCQDRASCLPQCTPRSKWLWGIRARAHGVSSAARHEAGRGWEGLGRAGVGDAACMYGNNLE